MAVGDITQGNSSISAGAYLSIQPASTAEWVIHNLYHEAEISLSWYDGANDIPCSAVLAGPGIETNLQAHVGNAKYLRVKNENSGAKRIGYDGVITHT